MTPDLTRVQSPLSEDPAGPGIRRRLGPSNVGGLRSDRMPLVAYFRNVGAALLALLLLAGFYLPAAPAVQGTAAYPPAIRIHSARKLPEPVVFDTTQVVFAAATPAPWDRN